MPQMTLNSELLTKLPTLNTETAIVDEKGKTLGIYKPIDYAKLIAQFSDEELERILQLDEWVTTEELLAYLEKR